MRTLDDLVRSGKVRYIGASSMWAWQFSKAQYTAKMNGWTPFVSMQSGFGEIGLVFGLFLIVFSF
jgi:aryl-alcohol dehydrogenase-like predicted oxidoreductase